MPDNQQPAVVNGRSALALPEVQQLGALMYQSGFFSDVKSAAQAAVKIQVGHEMGVPPAAAMMGVYITPQGKIGLNANLMASRIKGSVKYDYRIVKLSELECEIEFSANGKTLSPTSRFTVDDAKKAGLFRTFKSGEPSNWEKYPRNMLFARALSNGARWHCPDVFGGQTPFVPDELGAEVDEDGNAVRLASPQTPIADPTPPPPEPPRKSARRTVDVMAPADLGSVAPPIQPRTLTPLTPGSSVKAATPSANLGLTTTPTTASPSEKPSAGPVVPPPPPAAPPAAVQVYGTVADFEIKLGKNGEYAAIALEDEDGRRQGGLVSFHNHVKAGLQAAHASSGLMKFTIEERKGFRYIEKMEPVEVAEATAPPASEEPAP